MRASLELDTNGNPIVSASKVRMQEQAAQALCDLAYGDGEMQDAIIEMGGVTPLLDLVSDGSPRGQEYAARAIWNLCESIDNQSIIVEDGCIPELVMLAKAGSAPAQEVAAAGIAELAKGGITQRVRRQARAVRQSGRREVNLKRPNEIQGDEFLRSRRNSINVSPSRRASIDASALAPPVLTSSQQDSAWKMSPTIQRAAALQRMPLHAEAGLPCKQPSSSPSLQMLWAR